MRPWAVVAGAQNRLARGGLALRQWRSTGREIPRGSSSDSPILGPGRSNVTSCCRRSHPQVSELSEQGTRTQILETKPEQLSHQKVPSGPKQNGYKATSE